MTIKVTKLNPNTIVDSVGVSGFCYSISVGNEQWLVSEIDNKFSIIDNYQCFNSFEEVMDYFFNMKV